MWCDSLIKEMFSKSEGIGHEKLGEYYDTLQNFSQEKLEDMVNRSYDLFVDMFASCMGIHAENASQIQDALVSFLRFKYEREMKVQAFIHEAENREEDYDGDESIVIQGVIKKKKKKKNKE